MARRGHVPQRVCAGCRRRLPKESLVRFALGAVSGPKAEEAGDRQVLLDPQGKMAGRGAYVCPELRCFDEAAAKRKSLQRKLGGARLGPGLREEFVRLIERRDN